MDRVLSVVASIVGILLPVVASSIEWVEGPDAGPLPPSAQEPVDAGNMSPLTVISGVISASITDVPINSVLFEFGSSVADVDVYKIFIESPSLFSASTTGGDPFDPAGFDAILALFDEQGFGVYLNDDGVFDDGNSILPAGDPSGPMAPGIYYLAIFDDNVTAISSLDLNGPIFPEPPPPFTAVVGPTGPGGGSPVIDWFTSNEDTLISDGNYSIFLTGVVTVPEPGGIAQAVAALAIVGLIFAARRGDRIHRINL